MPFCFKSKIFGIANKCIATKSITDEECNIIQKIINRCADNIYTDKVEVYVTEDEERLLIKLKGNNNNE
jgi:hypothetical protein